MKEETMGPNVPGLLMGLALLVAIRGYLSRRGTAASLRSSIIAAGAGAMIYPLLLCSFMGLVASRAIRDDHGWIRFQIAFSTYAQAAPTDTIPRGAVMGVFLMAGLDLLGRMIGRDRPTVLADLRPEDAWE